MSRFLNLPNLMLFLAAFLTVSCAQTSKTIEENPTSLSEKKEPLKAGLNTDPNIHPNELGRIMVLEYHLIGEKEDRWMRTPQNFKKDLQLLYENNYYPVSALDLGKGFINVPAGKTPFALTFDDSSAGQFRYITKNGKTILDPDCALGIMEDFKKKHPDFPLTATFYVLPAIKPSLRLFAQPEFAKQKLEWLIKNGYEIGSHSWFHAPLHKLDDATVQQHLSNFVKDIKAFIPEYEVKSLALPLGMHAKNRMLEHQGKFENVSYNHQVVFLVGSASSVSPFEKSFNALAIERVQAGEHILGPEAMINRFKKNNQQFISDGNPKVISAPDSLKHKLNSLLAKTYTINLVKEKPVLAAK